MRKGEIPLIKNKRLLVLLAILFAVTEAALLILLETSGGELTKLFSYSGIILACIFCSLFAERSAAYILTQTALIFTAIADYFLVLPSSPNQLYAMLAFSITQLAYFLRLWLEDSNALRRKWHLICRGVIIAIAITLTLCVLGNNTDAIAIVSMFYYANLATNLLFACINAKSSPLMAVGFALFILCDTVIGLDMIDAYLPVSPVIDKIIHPGFNLAWVFYLPSQAILALSLLPNRLKGNNLK